MDTRSLANTTLIHKNISYSINVFTFLMLLNYETTLLEHVDMVVEETHSYKTYHTTLSS